MKKILFAMTLVFVLLGFSPTVVEANTLSKGVILDGEQIIMDGTPIIENGRTLVPVRGVLEAIGATVDWNQATKTATAHLGEFSASVTVDKYTAYVDGYAVNLDVPAKIVNGRTMVPLRFMAEALGYDVSYKDGWVYLDTPSTDLDPEFAAELEDFESILKDSPVKDYFESFSIAYSDEEGAVVLSFEGDGTNKKVHEMVNKPDEWEYYIEYMEMISMEMVMYFKQLGYEVNSIVEVIDDENPEYVLLKVVNGLVDYDIATE